MEFLDEIRKQTEKEISNLQSYKIDLNETGTSGPLLWLYFQDGSQRMFNIKCLIEKSLIDKYIHNELPNIS